MGSLDASTLKLLDILWHYNKIGAAPQAADLLLVMGTNDTRVAEYAASLAGTFPYRRASRPCRRCRKKLKALWMS